MRSGNPADWKASLACGATSTRHEQQPSDGSVGTWPETAAVGWLVDADHAGFVWDAPAALTGTMSRPNPAKSFAGSHAVIDMEARHFVVPCRISATLKIVVDPVTGVTVIEDASGDRSPVRSKALDEVVKCIPAGAWRRPDRPIIQVATPYVFISDAAVHMTQAPPFNHYPDRPWPGLVIGGRFSIDVWPRRLSWAFEWHDVGRELVLRRGDPWFYVTLETPDPNHSVRLVEAERTPELVAYMREIAGNGSGTNPALSPRRTTRSRRPKRLLVPKGS